MKFFSLILLLLLITYSSPKSFAQQVVQRCHNEVTQVLEVNPTLNIMDSSTLSALSPQKSRDIVPEAQAWLTTGYITSSIALSSDTLIYLYQEKEGQLSSTVQFLSAAKLDGSPLVINGIDQLDMGWFGLYPAYQTNRFVLVGSDILDNTYWAWGELVGDVIEIEPATPLPFYLNPLNNFQTELPTISPDGRYALVIELVDRHVETRLYNLSSNQPIWSHPYDGDGLVKAVWGNQPDAIIWLSQLTRQTRSQLYTISDDGIQTLRVDISNQFTTIDPKITQIMSGTVVGDYIAFLGNTGPYVNPHILFAYHISTDSLITYCATSSAGYPLFVYGDIVLFEADSQANLYKFLNMETGEYQSLTIEGGIVRAFSLNPSDKP